MSTIVSPPTSFTLRALQQALLPWVLTDQNGNPIAGATVTGTLYANRNLQNVTQFPGTAVTNFTNVSFVESPAGTYTASLPATINPPAASLGFATVITALSGSTPIGTWTIPTVVIPPQNLFDLVTLDQTKDYLGLQSSNTDDDITIQFLISGFSQYVLNRTGISSFTQTQTFNEIYDGNGNQRLFVLNPPIVTLNSVTIGSFSVPISTGLIVSGVYVEQSGRSIAFRNSGGVLSPPFSIYPYYFTRGYGNIQVNYIGGYTSVPFDLGVCTMKVVAQNYRRKDWIDLASKSLSAGAGVTGTTRYRDWAMPPECEETLRFFSRYARS